jgi:signal transduction histidine kinase/DNA-binding response OmpR family regulator
MAAILVVDDDPVARDLLVTVLGYAGHQMREAADGTEALFAAQAEPPDLIICDLLMPTMDGFEVVRRLRSHATLGSLPVIFYTASYLESEARRLATTRGVTWIIVKPAEPEQIFEAVNAVLGVPQPFVPPSPAEPEREQMSLLTARASQMAAQAVPRLQALIELGLKLASERDPERLLSDFCSSARKIIGAKYAVVGVLDKERHELRYQFASGMSPEIVARLGALQQPMELLQGVMSERRPRRLSGLPGNPQAVGLPGEHPSVHSFLCAPVVSPGHVYGWLCLADKIGASEFSEEDEGLAQILAAQVGRIYENGSLYAKVQRTVEALETEVAERQRVQEELHKLNAELERRVAERTAELEAANQELEAFSYSVSHDLRAPLRAVNGFTEILLESHAAQMPEEAQRLLHVVRNGAKRMGQLIDDLLTFSRLHRQPLSKQLADSGALVREALEELNEARTGRSVEVRIGELPVCWGDRALLKQVWHNLLSNALKFTRQRERAVVEVSCREQAAEQTYFVRDNGAGFDMAEAQRLFGVFERLHSAKPYEGTGIGLSIVRRIVHRHGGHVWAEGVVDQGATFFFTLPAPPEAAQPE